MHLERCSRLLPHDQDTGGFFVAILVKHAPLDAPAREREVTGSGGGEEGEEADGYSSRLEPPPQPSLPPSGPASCRELPELEPEQTMAPLPAREADEIGGRLGLKRGAARRRLLRRPNGPVHLAPAALSAFAPGTVRRVGPACPQIGDKRGIRELEEEQVSLLFIPGFIHAHVTWQWNCTEILRSKSTVGNSPK